MSVMPEYHSQFKCNLDCGCGECCGIIPFSKSFIKRHKSKIQKKFLKKIGFRGEKNPNTEFIYPMTKDLSCIFLTPQFKCAIYSERPDVCRKFGHILELPCPYVDIRGKRRSPEETKIIHNQALELLKMMASKK